MNSPRYVFPFSKIDESMKRIAMISKLITAIIEPIMVNQFFDAVGNFIDRVLFSGIVKI